MNVSATDLKISNKIFQIQMVSKETDETSKTVEWPTFTIIHSNDIDKIAFIEN